MATDSRDESYRVFISHSGGGGYKTILAKPLKILFSAVGISAFLDDRDLNPGDKVDQRIESALNGAEVFLVLFDASNYVQSVYCMEELELAFKKRDKKTKEKEKGDKDKKKKEKPFLIFPVFLDDTSGYPKSLSKDNKLTKCKGWDEKRFEYIISNIMNTNGLRAYEDKSSFELEHIVVSVQEFLENEISVNEDTLLDEIFRGKVVSLKEKVSEVSFPRGSVWRSLNPIRLCKAPLPDSKTVKLHEFFYEQVKQDLLAGNLSTSITGLKALGGVGKTWMAIRLVNDEDIKGYFVDGVLWAAFGEKKSTNQKALQNLWQDLSRGDTPLETDNLGDTARLFEQLVEDETNNKAALKRRSPKILLVLDDIWKAEYLEVFKPLVSKTSSIKLLITSRRQDILEEVFDFNEIKIERLPASLGEVEALELMERYATRKFEGAEAIDETDKVEMKRIAKIMGFHPKALSIIAAQAHKYASWEDFADTIEDNISVVAQKAKDEVHLAIDFTFDVCFGRENKERAEALKERFWKLGTFEEDARFSIDDVAIIWKLAKTRQANEVFLNFVEVSLVESEFQSSSTLMNETKYIIEHSDPSYYLHDLVRDYARNNTKRQQLEKEFVDAFIDIFLNEKPRASEYLFEWLPKHLARYTEKKNLVQDIESVYNSAKDGHVSQDWSQNAFLALTAIKSRQLCIHEIDKELCFNSHGFLEKAIKTYDNWDLENCLWCQDKQGLKKLTRVLKKNQNVVNLSLNNNQIGDEGAIELANALKKNKSLRSISLEKNKIGNDGALALVDALEANKTLKYIGVLPVQEFNQRKDIDLCSSRLLDFHTTIISKLLENNIVLEVLNLGGNQFGDEAATTLAKGVEKSQRLRDLSLWENGIGDDGAVALVRCLEKNSTLQKLILWNNQIKDKGAIALGNAIKKNTTLIELNLYKNQIGDPGAIAFGQALKKNSTLQKLRLEYNKIGNDGAISLADGLATNKSLRNFEFFSELPVHALNGQQKEKTINLSAKKLTDFQGLIISRLIRKNPFLETLNLGSNRVADDASIDLGNTLASNKALQVLYLDNNLVGDAGAIGLGKGLTKNSKLQKLFLEANDINAAGAIALGKSLKKNSTLLELHLHKNQIEDNGIIALGKGLEKNSSLKKLTLEENQIGDKGATALGKALKRNSALKRLNLEENQIGDNGALALSNALESNKTLRYLGPLPVQELKGKQKTETISLSSKELTDFHAFIISRLIQKNAFLQNLFLETNQIGEIGAIALGKALEKSLALKCLFLRKNQIGDAGAIALGTGLEANKSLQVLDLRWNEIRDNGAIAIGRALEINSTLLSIDLMENKVEDDGAIALGKSLEFNNTLQNLKACERVEKSLLEKDARFSFAFN